MTAKLFKQSPAKSWREYKDALRNLTPLDHAQAKQAGHFWAMLGGSTACAALLTQVPGGATYAVRFATLGFAILVGGISYLQYVEWRKETQKIENIRAFEEGMVKPSEVQEK